MPIVPILFGSNIYTSVYQYQYKLDTVSHTTAVGYFIQVLSTTQTTY